MERTLVAIGIEIIPLVCFIVLLGCSDLVANSLWRRYWHRYYYDIRPCKDKRGFDLISDDDWLHGEQMFYAEFPHYRYDDFNRTRRWYLNASDAIESVRQHVENQPDHWNISRFYLDPAISVYDDAGNVIYAFNAPIATFKYRRERWEAFWIWGWAVFATLFVVQVLELWLYGEWTIGFLLASASVLLTMLISYRTSYRRFKRQEEGAAHELWELRNRCRATNIAASI